TQAHHAVDGHPAGFALALAGARVVLALAYALSSGGRREGSGDALSAALFVVSAAVHRPYVVWAFALALEAGVLALASRGRGRGRGRDPRSLAPPRDPRWAVDAAHLAERFGLFMIILLGELVVAVGGAALDRPADDLGYWLALVGGLVLAGALWWVY